jgi:hypothetical protein
LTLKKTRKTKEKKKKKIKKKTNPFFHLRRSLVREGQAQNLLWLDARLHKELNARNEAMSLPTPYRNKKKEKRAQRKGRELTWRSDQDQRLLHRRKHSLLL